MPDSLIVALPFGAVGTFLIVWVLMFPDKVQQVSGMVWGALGRVWKPLDKRAAALRVQGHVNGACTMFAKRIPEGIFSGKLKLIFADAEQAKARLGDGEVLVFMKRSDQLPDNIAGAVMAYLPKALIPRARRYVDPCTMQAADLTVARSILLRSSEPAALDSFFAQHLDPARQADAKLDERLGWMDAADMHGWLLRVLLPEYRELGERHYPHDVGPGCVRDAEGMARWLGRLAVREVGDDTHPLAYEGRYLSAAVVFVARRERLLERGIDPYRKVAKRLVYSGKYDGVYLMGRDDNIYAVDEIVKSLRVDGRVEAVAVHRFDLRKDFTARTGLARTRAIIACLRPRRQREEEPPDVVEEADPGFTVELEISDELAAMRERAPSTAGTPSADEPESAPTRG